MNYKGLFLGLVLGCYITGFAVMLEETANLSALRRVTISATWPICVLVWVVRESAKGIRP
jgi:hypothetical protein